MTDQEHAKKITDAIAQVHAAVAEANKAGLEVTFEVRTVGTYANPHAQRLAFQVKRPIVAAT